MEPKYETYTLAELLEVKHNIDRDAYSDRYARVCEHIEKHRDRELLIKLNPQCPQCHVKLEPCEVEKNNIGESLIGFFGYCFGEVLLWIFSGLCLSLVYFVDWVIAIIIFTIGYGIAFLIFSLPTSGYYCEKCHTKFSKYEIEL